MARPINNGVLCAYCWAESENTGKIINSPSIRRAKMSDKPEIVRFSSALRVSDVAWCSVMIEGQSILICSILLRNRHEKYQYSRRPYSQFEKHRSGSAQRCADCDYRLVWLRQIVSGF